MTKHPLDAAGRVLPEPGWPSDRTAPGDLELVRRFCNSINRENGAERFFASGGFDDWLVSEDRLPTHPDAGELATVVAVRDALRDVVAANAANHTSPDAWRALADRLAPVAFEATATGDGLQLAATATTPTIAFLGELALSCMRALSNGTFTRLKSCVHCEWVVYDNSKNRSRRWCSMSACGGRHNARAYRRRRREHSRRLDPSGG